MFGHISSQYNPADCATRGLSKNELVDHFWWTGPEFVRVPTPNWEDLVKAIIVETTFDNEEYEFDPIQPLGVNTTSKADGMNPDFFRSIRVQTLSNVRRVVAYVIRLASKEEDGDFQLLADLTRMRDMDHKEMQMEIDGTALALHRQKKVAATLITQWNHHKNEDTFICASAGEQMLLTSHLLRQAEVTKEKLLRMGTRYLAMEGCYEDMTKWGDFDRQDWLNREREYAFGPDAILELVTNQCEMLTIEIKDMSVMLERQEKELKESDHLTSSQVQRILRKEIESLQCSFQLRSDLDALKEKVDAKRAEIDSLKECTRSEEDSVATSLEEIDEVGETMDRDTVMTEEREDEERHFEMEDEEDDDESYWRKMVREVNYESSEDEYWSERDEPSPKVRKMEGPSEIISRRIIRLRAHLLRMEHDLERFPFRDRRDESLGVPPWRICAFCGAEGIHFSDACPHVRDGDTRLDIVYEKGLCECCLEAPRGHSCRYRSRECWYCQRLSDSVFQDLRPAEIGFHHKAVCTVPDKKYIARAQMEEDRRELWILMAENAHEMDGEDTCVEAGVTTMSS
ncbi:hypothetical protein GCK32_010981 [Trichostrongylus colubriformis]|uniref:Uncharacterized protein n=1 Tax=Trichostrongylus colubriformis TaxID=6319 RepID=A0AAN8G3Q5_TRICO